FGYRRCCARSSGAARRSPLGSSCGCLGCSGGGRMNPLWMLGVAAAGGLGAGLRYVVDIGVTRAVTTRFPWGILVVNVSGSLALGVLTGMAFAGMSAVSPEASLLIGVGFLGGYTTFSTVAVETALLGEQ